MRKLNYYRGHRATREARCVETRIREPSRMARLAPTVTSKTSTPVAVPVGLPVGAPSGNRPEKEGDDIVDRPVVRIGEHGSWGAS